MLHLIFLVQQKIKCNTYIMEILRTVFDNCSVINAPVNPSRFFFREELEIFV
jgi:hypothetical protein